MLQEDYIEQLRSKGLDDTFELLTDREREILQLLAEGRANKEVASLLNISPTTVENASRPHPAEAVAARRPPT